ncbi:hypothetical protein ACOME3_009050 [Neoechinorhynchus agilis]
MESPAPEDKKITIGDEGSRDKDLIELVKMEMINRLLEDRKVNDKSELAVPAFKEFVREKIMGTVRGSTKRAFLGKWCRKGRAKAIVHIGMDGSGFVHVAEAGHYSATI